MGSLGSERNAKELIITQVSFGGFDENTSAKQLTDFLEYEAGTIWRCRLKRSWTPPDSYPDFFKDASSVKRKEDYEKVRPHAFVHFAVPDAARRAVNAVGKVLFTKETAFAFKGTSLMAVIKCDFKLEFSVRDIKGVNLYKDRAPFVMLLHLTSSPLLSYRTADDDIYTSVPFNLLDDEDPWMRTIDFTTVGAIGRTLLDNSTSGGRQYAWDSNEERRIIEYCPKRPLAVWNEPGFGTPMRDHFLCLPQVDGISVETMFMLNAVLHKGIVNQHQLSEELFGLLRSQSDSVNLTSLRHIYSYKNSILNAHKRLKLVQDWLIRNPKLVKSSKIGDDHVEVRRLVITPTKAYCLPPEVELSNRVLRKYKNVADRFLRVTFRDEGMQQLKGNVIKYDVFWRMQETMISKLNQMLEDTNVAFEVLTTSCADQGNTAAMMLSAGFKPQSEPHLKGMLSCIRSSQLGDLLEKARIFVPLGRWLMGCLDEVGILEQETKKNKQVITGTVVIAKNPCLHPGDVRILEAVDIPELHHLFDCLVFPQKGERPHANEASGSDLDGDLYFVTWEGNLIPPEKRSWIPMDYTPAEVKQLPRQDIIDFFSKNIVNENLGKICNAHVVHADMSEYGALDEKCLQLAELAAHAVDFPKTGKIVMMPHALRPKLYPDFMRKEDFQSYESEKILGKLYRRIVDASNEETVSPELTCRLEDLPYDTDLEIAGAADFMVEAWQCKCSYDGQLNALLGQYAVSSEGEVVTGHIWSMSKYTSRKRGELKERLNSVYHALQREFRRVFESLGPDSAAFTDEEKNSLYERKASAWYQVTYHPHWVKKLIEMREPDGEGVPILLSFAWIAIDYIVRIKVRGRDTTRMNGGNPIDSLANYLSERL
ncbi:RNA-dependent RNA polymerase 6 [Acorus calamus]|uniref:RNA-dependent RNA polymerase n=1 Tax=Acorus calamus TaxID=4465 RepID=A0AAV9C0W2_ACOCL|nr:RNA-dependent RNA polymerase 6 [Acorus calamus]